MEISYEEIIFQNTASQWQIYRCLLDQYDWAEKYIYYYVFVTYAIRESIPYILSSINIYDRNSYSDEKAWKYLKMYEQHRLSFAVIIPTCNRNEAVDYLMRVAAPLYRRYGIDIIIYDSSSDNKTEEAVTKMQKAGFLNCLYKKYNGVFDGFSLDHKIVSAYKEFADEYEYIWICRDGLIPIIDDFIDEMRIFAKNGIECIIVDTKSRNKGIEVRHEYSSKEDCCRLLLDQASRLQTLGMLILSSDLAIHMINEVAIDETTYSLWQMAAPFRLFAVEPYNIVYLVKDVFAINIQASTTHFWGNAEKTLKQWAENWYKVIELMPSEYDEIKRDVMQIYTTDFHPFYPREILRLRAGGGITFAMVFRYKKYLMKVTKTPLAVFYIAAATPVLIAKIEYYILVRHPKVTRRIRNIFIYSDEDINVMNHL